MSNYTIKSSGSLVMVLPPGYGIRNDQIAVEWMDGDEPILKKTFFVFGYDAEQDRLKTACIPLVIAEAILPDEFEHLIGMLVDK